MFRVKGYFILIYRHAKAGQINGSNTSEDSPLFLIYFYLIAAPMVLEVSSFLCCLFKNEGKI